MNLDADINLPNYLIGIKDLDISRTEPLVVYAVGMDIQRNTGYEANQKEVSIPILSWAIFLVPELADVEWGSSRLYQVTKSTQIGMVDILGLASVWIWVVIPLGV